jgi:leucyl aminopeptidase
MATLTGACVVALGSYATGLLSNQDRLARSLESAGRKAGEKVWQLPFWPEYEPGIKGKHGDIKNVGETGEAGAITAAFFLKNFIGEWPWAHLDIAGTAYQTGPMAKSYMGWGATGMGVRLCTQYLLDTVGKA